MRHREYASPETHAKQISFIGSVNSATLHGAMLTDEEFDVFLTMVVAQQAHNEQVSLALTRITKVVLETGMVTPEKWDQAMDQVKMSHHAQQLQAAVQKLPASICCTRTRRTLMMAL